MSKLKDKENIEAKLNAVHGSPCPTCQLLPKLRGKVGRLVPVVFEFGWQCSRFPAHKFSAEAILDGGRG